MLQLKDWVFKVMTFDENGDYRSTYSNIISVQRSVTSLDYALLQYNEEKENNMDYLVLDPEIKKVVIY